MKRFAAAASAVVSKLMEEIEDEDFSQDLIHDLLPPADRWVLVGGDENPWEYGGTWYNAERDEVIHFEGLEDASLQPYEPDDVDVPQRVLDNIKKRVHDPYLDTDEAKQDPAFLKRMLDSEDWDMHQIIERYKLGRAEFLNHRLQYNFFRAFVPSDGGWPYDKYDEEMARQFGDNAPDYLKQPAVYRFIEIAGSIGWHEVGEQFPMSYNEYLMSGLPRRRSQSS